MKLICLASSYTQRTGEQAYLDSCSFIQSSLDVLHVVADLRADGLVQQGLIWDELDHAAVHSAAPN